MVAATVLFPPSYSPATHLPPSYRPATQLPPSYRPAIAGDLWGATTQLLLQQDTPCSDMWSSPFHWIGKKSEFY